MIHARVASGSGCGPRAGVRQRVTAQHRAIAGASELGRRVFTPAWFTIRSGAPSPANRIPAGGIIT
eukprot:7086894-Prymnesium_polylepis.1